ncbi:metalloregulator ArsR/SmtB family transcription factor [Zobellella iuensis]|uniref:Metalloregulator ArsR/SmtB family transcription factor n=1 Tax=Zobellella iuensis TaxID=2803811 RepID=A0ABS1QTH5_9GAMM|nr:metalloregulator ArsR/SmtB family transcription factor [Zobellella iuensis]MBL1378174.1 metalloregulator ArsR/SmtB family transcription factor [Zobellella iuensis]
MKKRVLFLCTANSARSLMAEALLRQHGGDQFEVYSAGTAPESVAQGTLDALSSLGISTEGLQSKSLANLPSERFDFVISLCEKAHRECQDWPVNGVVMAWDFADPRASEDPKAFIKTLQEINERIRLFILVNSKTIATAPKEPLGAVDFYKCIGDEVRLKICLLIHAFGQLCVYELTEALTAAQPKVSRNLGLMRKCGILLDQRHGQWVYYQLNPALAPWMLDVIRLTHDACADLIDESKTRIDNMSDRPQQASA